MQNYNRIIKDTISYRHTTDYVTNYYLDDLLHRIDGPAKEWNDGTKCWFQNGKRHRIDGPACEWIDGTKEWWFEGKHIDCNSQEEFERYIKLKLFW